MSNSQSDAVSVNRAVERFKMCIETYKTSMKSFITAQTVWDREKLKAENAKIIKTVSDGFIEEDKLDLMVLLDEHLLNMLVLGEEGIWQNPKEKVTESSLCIYLTDEWVYVVGYTSKLGGIDIHFGNSNGKPGIPAAIRHMDGKLAWMETCDKRENGNPLTVVDLFLVISGAYNGNETDRKLLEEVFARVKKSSEGMMKQSVSRLMLVTSYYFSHWYFRQVLRDCCMTAGFNNIVIASDKSFAASGVFLNLELGKQIPQPISILVVIIYSHKIILYIFGGDIAEDQVQGVQLLAAANCDSVCKERDSVENGYKRVLSQLPTQTRDSTRYYLVLNEENYSYQETIVDKVFQDDHKLIKSENIRGGKLKDVFSHFCSDPTKQKKYFEILNSVPVDDRISGNPSASELKSQAEPETPRVPSTSSAYRQIVALGSDTLPLTIEILDERTYKVIALTNWTVKHLKEEIIKVRLNKQCCGQLVLQYGAKVLNDYSLLRSYNIDPESVIQAKFAKVILVQAQVEQNAIRDSPVTIQLIGNCVASKNGTEAVEVKGIKEGSLVLSRLDFDNVTMGEVVKACTITGFGDTVYVGIKFDKQLELESLGTKLVHADEFGGYCDKCDGGTSLFIPLQHVGSSKDHLFQVQ